MWWNLPSFLSKNGVKSYPGVGLIAESIQCLFLNRVGTKEEKRTALHQISDRQEICEKGLMPPLLIYPEGCTTNNEYLI